MTESNAAATSSSASFVSSSTNSSVSSSSALGNSGGIEYIWNEHVIMRYPLPPRVTRLNVHGVEGYNATGNLHALLVTAINNIIYVYGTCVDNYVNSFGEPPSVAVVTVYQRHSSILGGLLSGNSLSGNNDIRLGEVRIPLDRVSDPSNSFGFLNAKQNVANAISTGVQAVNAVNSVDSENLNLKHTFCDWFALDSTNAGSASSPTPGKDNSSNSIWLLFVQLQLRFVLMNLATEEE